MHYKKIISYLLWIGEVDFVALFFLGSKAKNPTASTMKCKNNTSSGYFLIIGTLPYLTIYAME